MRLVFQLADTGRVKSAHVEPCTDIVNCLHELIQMSASTHLVGGRFAMEINRHPLLDGLLERDRGVISIEQPRRDLRIHDGPVSDHCGQTAQTDRRRR